VLCGYYDKCYDAKVEINIIVNDIYLRAPNQHSIPLPNAPNVSLCDLLQEKINEKIKNNF